MLEYNAYLVNYYLVGLLLKQLQIIITPVLYIYLDRIHLSLLYNSLDGTRWHILTNAIFYIE